MNAIHKYVTLERIDTPVCYMTIGCCDNYHDLKLDFSGCYDVTERKFKKMYNLIILFYPFR
jgi:hypothetical protein